MAENIKPEETTEESEVLALQETQEDDVVAHSSVALGSNVSLAACC
jgi:hypothetical protein